MNKRWIPIVAVVMLLCAVVAPAQMAGTPSKHAGRAAALADYLQLTPEQVRTWEQVRNDTATDMKPLAQDARDMQKQLHAAMNATSPDPATVGKLSLELRSLRAPMRAVKETSTAKFVATLTPEQKVRFDAFLLRHVRALAYESSTTSKGRHCPISHSWATRAAGSTGPTPA